MDHKHSPIKGMHCALRKHWLVLWDTELSDWWKTSHNGSDVKFKVSPRIWYECICWWLVCMSLSVGVFSSSARAWWTWKKYLHLSLHCGPWARQIYPSLVLVQPRKTCPYITERLLMGRNESNQTNKNIRFCRLLIIISKKKKNFQKVFQE